MTDSRESPSQFSPEGPVQPASAFMRAVLEEADMRSAWELMTPTLRAELAAGWVGANRAHRDIRERQPDELIESLAVESPADPLWPAFAITQLGEFRAAWSNIDLDTWGWASNPRAHGLDQELVILADAGGQGEAVTPPDDVALPALGIVMEHTGDRWRVAEFVGEEELLAVTAPAGG